MDKYYVQVDDGEGIYFLAEEWILDANGLKFFKNKEIIAYFTTFKYWMIIDENSPIRRA